MLPVLAREGLSLSELHVLVRPGAAGRAAAKLGHPDATYHEDVAGLIASAPDLVVEVATHDAVRDAVPACLRAGLTTVLVSVGALADAETEAALTQAAREGGAQLRLVPGAVGGIDALAAAKVSGLTSVIYTSRKPPAAWKGTPAEELLPLGTLASAATFYEGNARQAAQDYPKNANVAATVALAGLGFEDTQVQMIADPAAPGNIHEVTVTAEALEFTIRLQGHPLPENVKTSASTVYSVAREVLNAVRPVTI